MPKVSRQVYSRPPMERMLRIHALLQNSEYPNASSMGREFELCVRTVGRDVDFMRDRLKLPISWDARQNGYFYSKPVEHFPMMPMSQAETFSLLVAHKAIAQYQGTPFQKPLESAFRRLTGQLDNEVHFTMAGAEELSFRPLAPDDVDWKHFEVLTQAIKGRRVLRFRYRNRGVTEVKEREVHPYHVPCVHNSWYLVGFDVKRNAVRTFALTRMRKLELGKGRFQVSKQFNLEEYLRGSFGVYTGNTESDYHVVVEFDAWAADEIRGRRWHATQELTEIPKGMLRLGMRLTSLEEVERWLLSFGGHGTVVSPDALRQRLASIGREFVAKYDA